MAEDKKIYNINGSSEAETKDLDLEVAFSRLKKIGRDKFQWDSHPVSNYPSKIKSSSHFFNLNLPPEYGEYFISFEDSQLFWILDSPVLQYLEEPALKGGDKEGVKQDTETGKLVKDYYSKWVTAARKSEQKYFAQSLLKAISKDRNKGLLNNILAGVLFSFDETLQSLETALQYFDQADMLAKDSEGDDSIKSEIRYLLKVYSGFAYYKFGKVFEANQVLKESLVYKPDGITARLYLGMTEIILGNLFNGNDYVCDIYEYDLKRIAYAMGENNIVLFQYFMKNPIFLNIFNYREFAGITAMLDEYLQGKELDSGILIQKLRKKFEIFTELHLNEYQGNEVKTSMAFFDKLIKGFFTSQLSFFLASLPSLMAKFNGTLQFVFDTIRERFVAENQVHLRIYDQNIADLQLLIEHLTKEIGDLKVKYKEKTKASIALYEEKFQEHMDYLERKLTGVSGDSPNNPAAAFKGSMTYSIILSILIMLVIGFASYSTNYAQDETGYVQLFRSILITGGKWGIITFVFGVIVSVFSAVYAVYEKSVEKQRIVQEISDLKFRREKGIETIKSDAERAEKITVKNLNERTEQYKKRIEDIQIERKKREEELNAIIEKKIKEEAEKLLELIEKE